MLLFECILLPRSTCESFSPHLVLPLVFLLCFFWLPFFLLCDRSFQFAGSLFPPSILVKKRTNTTSSTLVSIFQVIVHRVWFTGLVLLSSDFFHDRILLSFPSFVVDVLLFSLDAIHSFFIITTAILFFPSTDSIGPVSIANRQLQAFHSLHPPSLLSFPLPSF